jgi:hypothetical protein
MGGRDYRRTDGIGSPTGRRNPHSRTQYRINIANLDRTLAIEDELLVLTDAEGVVLMGKGKMNILLSHSTALGGIGGDRVVRAA